MPHTSVYGGWGANWLSTESTNSENNMDYEETGYVLGLDFRHPIGDTKLSYYVRAGALYNHIEIENPDGDILDDSGHGPGFQLAAGLDISLGSGWSLTPGFKFNYLSRETSLGGITKQLDYQYLSARVGIMKKF
jgi:opacity protein-like surface antigen